MMRPAITGGARASPVIRSFGSEAGLKAARSSAAATRASTQGLYANGLGDAAEKPSTDLRCPCGPSPGSAPVLLAHAYTMHSLRCSSLQPDLSHLDHRISRRGFPAAPLGRGREA